jgi:flagellar protein FliS
MRWCAGESGCNPSAGNAKVATRQTDNLAQTTRIDPTMFSTPFAASPTRTRQFAGAYQQVGMQTNVGAASSHQLVTLLFDGFAEAVHRARGAMRKRDVVVKGRAIGHAMRIVDEGLRAALDLKAGGKLATDLADLYTYICLRLAQANLHNDERVLDECLGLMQPLREAWAAIGDGAEVQARN